MLLEHDLEGNSWFNNPAAGVGRGLSGRLPKGPGFPGFRKPSDSDKTSLKALQSLDKGKFGKDTAKYQKTDLRTQLSTNQFIQRSFKIEKTYFTKAAKYIDDERKVAKSRVRRDDRWYKEDDRNTRLLRRHWSITEKYQKENIHSHHLEQKYLKTMVRDLNRMLTISRAGMIGKMFGLAKLPLILGAAGMKTLGSALGLIRNARGGGGRRGGRAPDFNAPAPLRGKPGSRLSDIFYSPHERLERREQRETYKAEKMLRKRGFSDAEIQGFHTQGRDVRELAQDKRYDKRSRLRRVGSALTHPIRHPLRTIGAPFRAIGSVGRGIGRVGAMAGRMAPLLGAGIEGGLSAKSFSEGNYFGGVAHGAGALASLIPGVGPVVGVIIDKLLNLVPKGMQESFNKKAGPIFNKIWTAIGGGTKGGFMSSIGSVLVGLGTGLNTLWRVLDKSLLNPSFLGFLGKIGDFVMTSGGLLASGFEGFAKFIEDIVNGKSLSESFEKNLTPVIKDGVDKMMPLVSDAIVAMFRGLQFSAKLMVDISKALIEAVASKVTGGVAFAKSIGLIEKTDADIAREGYEHAKDKQKLLSGPGADSTQGLSIGQRAKYIKFTQEMADKGAQSPEGYEKSLKDLEKNIEGKKTEQGKVKDERTNTPYGSKAEVALGRKVKALDSELADLEEKKDFLNRGLSSMKKSTDVKNMTPEQKEAKNEAMGYGTQLMGAHRTTVKDITASAQAAIKTGSARDLKGVTAKINDEYTALANDKFEGEMEKERQQYLTDLFKLRREVQAAEVKKSNDEKDVAEAAAKAAAAKIQETKDQIERDKKIAEAKQGFLSRVLGMFKIGGNNANFGDLILGQSGILGVGAGMSAMLGGGMDTSGAGLLGGMGEFLGAGAGMVKTGLGLLGTGATAAASGVSSLISRIGGTESGGNYNAVFGAKPGEAPQGDLSKKTLAEVMTIQANLPKGKGAIGKYQFMPRTLKDLVAKSGMNPNTTLFDTGTQDKLYQIFEGDNVKQMKGYGLPVNDATIKGAHYLGAKGLAVVMANTDPTLSVADVLEKNHLDANRANNKELTSMKAVDFVANMGKRMGSGGIGATVGTAATAAGQGGMKLLGGAGDVLSNVVSGGQNMLGDMLNGEGFGNMTKTLGTAYNDAKAKASTSPVAAAMVDVLGALGGDIARSSLGFQSALGNTTAPGPYDSELTSRDNKLHHTMLQMNETMRSVSNREDPTKNIMHGPERDRMVEDYFRDFTFRRY